MEKEKQGEINGKYAKTCKKEIFRKEKKVEEKQ